MNILLLRINEIDGLFHWILATIGILFAYVIAKEAIKLFSKVDEEMWGERDQ